MNSHDVIAELKKAGSTQRMIAARLQVTPQTVSGVIHGRVTSRRVASAIAGAIGRQIEQVWPSRYRTTASGRRA